MARHYLIRLMLALTLVFQSARFDLIQSAFDDMGVGGRATAMGDAFTAVADDANAAMYNPAGLVQLPDGEITTQYGQVLRGLDDGSSLGTTYLGWANPLRLGRSVIGAAYHNFKADNLFTERTIVVSYGQRLDIAPFGWNGIWSGGVNVKQLYHQYQPDRFTENALNDAGGASNKIDPLFESGYAKAAYAADAGLLYQFGQGYKYTTGLVFTNINRPDVSLKGDDDKVPFIGKLGIAYRPRWGSLSAEVRRAKRLASQSDSEFAFGGERNIVTSSIGALILRAGYGEGTRGFKAVTAGLGYVYSKFRLDYAFNFPIGNLADTNGSQRISFSFRMGGATPETSGKDYSKVNLLAAFVSDSLTTHIVLTRFSLDRRMTPNEKDQQWLLLMRKYPLDDPGLKNVKADLREVIRRRTEETLDWNQTKWEILRGLPEADKANAGQALELLIKGDAKSSLARIALLGDSTQKNNKIVMLSLFALSELSAQTYRDANIDACIDHVRRIVDILPSDEVVMRAYRQLLLERNKLEPATKTEDETLSVTEDMPEAPRELVAPNADETQVIERPASEKEVTSRNFATSLGYYLIRKSKGASTDELVVLLNQMKAVFGPEGMDMSVVDKELAALGKAEKVEKVVPVEAPKAAPEPKQPVKKAISAPVKKSTAPVKKATATPSPAAPKVEASNPELDRAWDYYKQAVDRDISDHEKIEILQSMLTRFGEKGAAKINKELQRIKKRLE